MKSVAFHNLGCKVNAYEMDVMQQNLLKNGYRIVPFASGADIYIVNTCTVTNIADRKSRQMLHRARKQNPEAVVVAVGCYVQTGGEEALQDAGIDLAVGNSRKKDIVEILEAFLAERERRASEAPNAGEKGASGVPEETAQGMGLKTLWGSTVPDIAGQKEYERMSLSRTAEHTRAYIKIQDGCNQFCSYCIIPYARGRVRSRTPGDVLEEVRTLAAAGYREVVLTGIHLSSYGLDFAEAGQNRLIGLIEEIGRTEGIERLRIGSLEPRIITEEFAQRLAAQPKVCPHFHLSLQSGCDATLRRMNRRYTTGEYYEKVQLLRRHYEHPAVTTDVIVGFPGETEEEFEQTRAFLEKVGFYEMHVFKYSRRRGTAADRLPEQLTDAVKSDRSNVLLELEKRQSRLFREYYIGRPVRVLLEEKKTVDGREYRTGYNETYVKAALQAEGEPANRFREGVAAGFLDRDTLLLSGTGTGLEFCTKVE